MPDGKRTTKVVEIRIEERGKDGEKNPGSVIPGNLRVSQGERIIWFASQRIPPELPSAPPSGSYDEKATRLTNATIILSFKTTDGTPFKDEKGVRVDRLQGRDTIAVTVPAGATKGGKETIYHYGVEVLEGEKVIFRDLHCPEIIIDR